jgi:hypothetical protein
MTQPQGHVRTYVIDILDPVKRASALKNVALLMLTGKQSNEAGTRLMMAIELLWLELKRVMSSPPIDIATHMHIKTKIAVELVGMLATHSEHFGCQNSHMAAVDVCRTVLGPEHVQSRLLLSAA